jgi:Dyp-type peroxidase family
VHLLLLVYADTAARLGDRLDALRDTADGFTVAATLRTATLGPNENFGFHDGISQPRVQGLGPTGEIKPGEFVLGYENEYGQYVDDALLRNGTYLVLRTLRQDIEAFQSFAEEATRDASGRPDPTACALLQAKMVGRWPSGAPLVLAPGADDPSLADANEFGYQHADPRGIACPIGSHVRRANPRDTLDPQPGTEASLAINRRHRLLRRGRAYGDPAASGTDRGVHFIALSANLARQYEFVQHTWVNNPAFNGLDDETDPVLGVRRPKNTFFTTPGRPVRRRYADLPQFVHVRGGAYFFLPGLATLRTIAGAAH